MHLISICFYAFNIHPIKPKKNNPKNNPTIKSTSKPHPQNK